MNKILIFFVLFTPFLLKAEEKVILHLLDPSIPRKSGEQFWFGWNQNLIAVKQTKKIKGESATKIIELLTSMLQPTEAVHFCEHKPVYGIVAFRADNTKLKTSLCFDCLTWVMPKKRLNISGERGLKNELCIELQKHIKLPVGSESF